MIISGLGWCARDLGLDPSARVKIKDMSVIEVNIAIFLASIVVSLSNMSV